MAQKRDAPAYQEYAASILALAKFKELTLAERGLLYTLKMECWVNQTVPKDIQKLARYIGCEGEELELLLPQVMQFFSVSKDRINSPELDNYRIHLESVKVGRKKGAIATNAIKAKKKQDAQATDERTQKVRSSVNSANAKSTLPSIVQYSSVKSSTESLQPARKIYIPVDNYTFNPDDEVEL